MALVTMAVPKLIQSYRNRNRMSVPELATRIGVSPSMLKKYEAGACPVPQDVVVSASRALKAPLIKKVYCHEHGLAVVDTPILNHIDTHPVVVTAKLDEETCEFQEDLKRCRETLINKRGPEDLSAQDREFIGHTLAEYLDVCTGGEIWVLEVCDLYDFDLESEVQKHTDKCRRKGHIQRAQEPENVVPLFAESQPTYA